MVNLDNPPAVAQPRVLFVAAMAGLGGPVRRLATLLSNLVGVDRVLLKPISPQLDSRMRAQSAIDEHIALPRSAQRDRLGALLISVAIVRRCLRRKDTIDVIHANGLVEFALAWPAAFFLRKPIVVWVGNYEPPRTVNALSPLFRSVGRRAKWTAVSSLAADVIAGAGLAERGDVQVVSNIVDPDDVRTTARTRTLDLNVVTIGYLQVARWEKGFDLLPAIINQLRDLRGSVKFLLYSSETSHPTWSDLRAIGTPFVEIRPRTGNVSEIYADCDLVLSPSRKESFNRVVAEALTTGTPVVASDLEPLREVVGDAGFLFPVDEPAKAAEQLRRLVTDKELRLELGRRGMERSERWHPAPVAELFAQTYRDMARRARR